MTEERGNPHPQVRILVAEVQRRERERQRLLDAVFERYELAPRSYAKRGQVHAHVCERLRLAGSNGDALAIRDALRALNVLPVNHGGTRLYRGLRTRESGS